MQNNQDNSNSKSKFRTFFQDKGYYIVLFLCILAVGISGYIFISSAVSEKNSTAEESLSVATPATVPSTNSSAATTEKKTNAAETLAPEDSAEASAVWDDDNAVREAAASIRVWPVSGSTLMAYSMDKLSYNETTQDWRTHDGVDIAAISGETVMAAEAGTVSAVYDDDFLGTTVVISHKDGYTTQYSNLAAMPTVSAGDTVAAGDIIGAVGSTALLESGETPHLHFAVFLDNTAVDPNDYLS